MNLPHATLLPGMGATILLGMTALLRAATTLDKYTDPRDGYAYTVVTIGRTQGFAENLRYETPDSRCYPRTTSPPRRGTATWPPTGIRSGGRR